MKHTGQHICKYKGMGWRLGGGRERAIGPSLSPRLEVVQLPLFLQLCHELQCAGVVSRAVYVI